MQAQEYSVLGSLRVQVTDVQKKKENLVSVVKLFSTRALQRKLGPRSLDLSPQHWNRSTTRVEQWRALPLSLVLEVM